MNIDNVLISKKSVYAVLFTTFTILLLPLIAMQFTSEVNWEIDDFIVAATLLSFFGYSYTVIAQTANNKVTKALVGLIVFGLFMLVWVSLI